ncbi:MAG: glycosyltransferase family 2 protein [Anaerolineae bacterium]
MNVDLRIIIVSWNVSTLLEACLRSIYTMDSGLYSYEVVVVDNASSDNSVAMIQTQYPQVLLISSIVNLGFTRANNLALADCKARYALLLNPDTEVTEGAIQRMLEYLDAQPEMGLVGPRLVYGDGRPQPSRRRFPTLGMALAESTPWEWHFPHNRLACAYRMEDRPDSATQEVDWITGACILVRRKVWEQVGAFDEQFFMYSEELDWCRRIRMAGWKVIYLPTATVIHYEGASSGQVVAARSIRFNASKVHYFAKHHGWLQAMVLRVLILAMYVYEWVIEALKWLFGHKRSVRLERVRAYGQVIHSGLRLQVGPKDG